LRGATRRKLSDACGPDSGGAGRAFRYALERQRGAVPAKEQRCVAPPRQERDLRVDLLAGLGHRAVVDEHVPGHDQAARALAVRREPALHEQHVEPSSLAHGRAAAGIDASMRSSTWRLRCRRSAAFAPKRSSAARACRPARWACRAASVSPSSAG